MINLKTAKALGLDVLPMLLARADEVVADLEGTRETSDTCGKFSVTGND